MGDLEGAVIFKIVEKYVLRERKYESYEICHLSSPVQLFICISFSQLSVSL